MRKLILITILGILAGIFLLSFPVKAQTTQISDYLANPGIGWQEAHTFSSPLLPETVAYRRSQYSWAQENPSDGVYNFAPIDADIAAAASQGKQFSFRIYTVGSGGIKIPQWVIDKGATTINNLPDFSNCEYQDAWGKFVDAMKAHFDGNPNIAFIDISGYGNFNEWSWTDGQTNITPGSLDDQARKRLADMFIGGSGKTQCGSYSYPGFTKTQLVMPYAGIKDSTIYVNSKRADVGFRNDCLGRANEYPDITTKVGSVVQRIWPVAPVVFEFCGSTSTTPDLISNADTLLKWAHGSLAHDNFSGTRDLASLTNILRNAGYRYWVSGANFPGSANASGNFNLDMTWTNSGYAPNYPKMGQVFGVHAYLIKSDGSVASVDAPVTVNTASWLPGNHSASVNINVPANLDPGTYTLKVGIIEARTGKFINLAMPNRDAQGRYPIGTIQILPAGQTAAPSSSPTTIPTVTPTNTPTQTPTTPPIVYVNPPSPSPTSQTHSTATSKPVNNPVPRVQGISTQIRELPKTGLPSYFFPSLGSLVFMGVYLRKRFRLV